MIYTANQPINPSIDQSIRAIEVSMETTVTATDARIHFGEMIRRVIEEQDTIIVERGGEPKLVMLSINEYTRLQNAAQHQDAWLERIQQVRAHISANIGDREIPASEDIIRQMRDEQYGQFPDLH
jgi:prevent-host-death family protein